MVGGERHVPEAGTASQVAPPADYYVDLKRRLLAGESQVFVNVAASILIPLIEAYNPESDDFILQAAASISFLDSYIQQARQQNLQLAANYPLEIRKKAQQICNRFYTHSSDKQHQPLRERMVQTEIWLYEGAYCEHPMHWSNLYESGRSYLLQQHLAIASIECLEAYILQEIETPNRKILYNIVKKFLTDYGPQGGAFDETLGALAKRGFNILQWFNNEAERITPLEFFHPRAHVAIHWQCFKALGFESFEQFAVSSNQALVQHLSVDNFKQRNDDKDKAIIIRAVCIRLSSSKDFADEHINTLYLIIKHYVQHTDVFSDLECQENLAAAFKYILFSLSPETIADSLRSNFSELDDESRNILVQALRIILKCERVETCDKYTALKMIDELLTIDNRLDLLPQQIINHAQYFGFRLEHYYADKLDGYLTLDNFNKSSIRGRSFIVRATLLRLIRRRFEVESRLTNTMCSEYMAILRTYAHGDSPIIQQAISWFDDEGRVCLYPQWWLKTASLEAICTRVINYEFAGHSRLFYRSQHEILTFIFNRKWEAEEDINLLVTIAIERLGHISHLKHTQSPLIASQYPAEHCAQLLELMFNCQQAPNCLQAYQQTTDVVEPFNQEAITSIWQQQNELKLPHFWIHSSQVTQDLTTENYDKLCPQEKKIFAYAALARLEYTALIKADYFTRTQLGQYIQIVSLNLLSLDDDFSQAAEKMLNCYRINSAGKEAYFDTIKQIKKEKLFCQIEVTPTLNEYLEAEDIEYRKQLCESGLGQWAVRLIADHAQEQRLYLKETKKLPSPKERSEVKRSVVNEDFWIEKSKPVHQQMPVLVDIINLYMGLPTFQGDISYIKRLLKHYTADGYYDHRFIMYKDAIERRFDGKATDFIVHQPTLNERNATARWEFIGPNVITSFLGENHFNEGSVERKLLFLKAIVCLCENVSAEPEKKYVNLMLTAQQNQELLSWIHQEETLFERMRKIIVDSAPRSSATLFSRENGEHADGDEDEEYFEVDGQTGFNP